MAKRRSKKGKNGRNVITGKSQSGQIMRLSAIRERLDSFGEDDLFVRVENGYAHEGELSGSGGSFTIFSSPGRPYAWGPPSSDNAMHNSGCRLGFSVIIGRTLEPHKPKEKKEKVESTSSAAKIEW